MYTSGLSNLLSKLVLNNVSIPKRNISLNGPLNLRVTQILLAEPLKKKKRLDPAVIRERVIRRRKKLEKFLRRMEKKDLMLKPISELQAPPQEILKEYELRMQKQPPPTPEELEEKARMLREWNKIKCEEHRRNLNVIDRLIKFQEKSLKELRKKSETLYQKAIE
ncbi:hypothetical protein QAD02_005260, partial [Eretmocerus hayati]